MTSVPPTEWITPMLVRRLARPLLGSMFVVGGLDAARHPRAKASAAGSLVGFLKDNTSLPLPDDPATVVRLDGVAKLIAGLALALGRAPRLAAAVLGVSLVPTTLAAHRFWEAGDDSERAQQQIQFFKNASMLGGLLLAVVDTEGKPSVAWRSRRAARGLSRNVGQAAESAAESAERVARKTRKALPV